MNKEQQELVYRILKTVALAPRVALKSNVPFLDGLPVRQPIIDITDEQSELLAQVLNELATDGSHWGVEGDA